MEKFETHVVILSVSAVSDGRTILEKIQGEKFNSTKEAKDVISSGEEVIGLMILSMPELMDYMNDQDDSTPKEDKLNIGECWVGYVQIKKS
jgi:hypothetical protein